MSKIEVIDKSAVKPQTLPIIITNKTADLINKQVENVPFVTA